MSTINSGPAVAAGSWAWPTIGNSSRRVKLTFFIVLLRRWSRTSGPWPWREITDFCRFGRVCNGINCQILTASNN
jgi:hypothetical protein